MQFNDPYPSYCHQHLRTGLDLAEDAPTRKGGGGGVARRRRKTPDSDTERATHQPAEMCTICYDQMGAFHELGSVQSPCCKNGWFHRGCLRRFAANAGYFFKCPMCNNSREFRDAVRLRGVFVPDR